MTKHQAQTQPNKPPLEVQTKSASTTGIQSSPTEFPDARRRRTWELRATVTGMLPGHRVGSCGHRVIPGRAPAIYRRAEAGQYFYGGVQSCGAVWVCPYCAVRIGSHRADELRRGLVHAHEQGLSVTLLTFTAQHHRGQQLSWLLDAMTRVLRRLKSGRAWQAWAKRAGYVGQVRNIEVTYGAETSWHPHVHALWFLERSISVQDEVELHRLYAAAAVAEGLYTDPIAGLVMSSAPERIEGYLTKIGKKSWAGPEELALAGLKRARAGQRFSPFDLVRAYQTADNPEQAGYYRRLWRTYARAFKGRRQLYWSRGLRARLGLVKELTDEEAANIQTKEAALVITFTPAVWARLKRGLARLRLLEAAERGGLAAILLELRVILGPDWEPGEGWAPGIPWGQAPAKWMGYPGLTF